MNFIQLSPMSADERAVIFQQPHLTKEQETMRWKTYVRPNWVLGGVVTSVAAVGLAAIITGLAIYRSKIDNLVCGLIVGGMFTIMSSGMGGLLFLKYKGDYLDQYGNLKSVNQLHELNDFEHIQSIISANLNMGFSRASSIGDSPYKLTLREEAQIAYADARVGDYVVQQITQKDQNQLRRLSYFQCGQISRVATARGIILPGNAAYSGFNRRYEESKNAYFYSDTRQQNTEVYQQQNRQ